VQLRFILRRRLHDTVALAGLVYCIWALHHGRPRFDQLRRRGRLDVRLPFLGFGIQISFGGAMHAATQKLTAIAFRFSRSERSSD
jgi:hypothetical protein